MTDASSDPGDPFSASSAQNQGFERRGEADEVPGGDPSSWSGRSAFALDMARMWVKEHQKTTMLGAFAVGVFVGALSRD
jgi:hypothetical protein